jgi:hypothetical protein
LLVRLRISGRHAHRQVGDAIGLSFIRIVRLADAQPGLDSTNGKQAPHGLVAQRGTRFGSRGAHRGRGQR